MNDMTHENLLTHLVDYKRIAMMLRRREVVGLYQGESEGGPRALGNRSILYDPSDENGKEIVNKIKKREWYRPFGASILKEDVDTFFDMKGLEESPYMLYAVNVKEGMAKHIPCVVHVDNTCRIQTVTKEQNKHLYMILKEFKKLTGLPLLLNTSLNIAGYPLIEKKADAIDMLEKTNLNGIYFPEEKSVITKCIR